MESFYHSSEKLDNASDSGLDGEPSWMYCHILYPIASKRVWGCFAQNVGCSTNRMRPHPWLAVA
jgi:hypothetical protein